jgi:hypothetical protein
VKINQGHVLEIRRRPNSTLCNEGGSCMNTFEWGVVQTGQTPALNETFPLPVGM